MRNPPPHRASPPSASGSAADTDIAALPAGEREILRLIAMSLLCAVSESHRYAETTVTVECAGYSFTTKGKTVLVPGWKSYEQEQAEAASTLPEVTEHQSLSISDAAVKTGKTTPPKPYTEDTLPSAMETAGKAYWVPAKSQDFVGEGGAAERASFSPQDGNDRYGACDDAPEDAERKGIGTPATRSGIIEKLVSSGFVERKKSKKVVNLLPTSTGTALITVLSEQLQSPQLTTEWEHNLKQIERGELSPEVFLEGIANLLRELVQTDETVKDAEVLFPSGREVIGKYPYCGRDVTESKQFFL